MYFLHLLNQFQNGQMILKRLKLNDELDHFVNVDTGSFLLFFPIPTNHRNNQTYRELKKYIRN